MSTQPKLQQKGCRGALALERLERRCLLATAAIGETFRTFEFESDAGTFYYLYSTPLERDEIPSGSYFDVAGQAAYYSPTHGVITGSIEISGDGHYEYDGQPCADYGVFYSGDAEFLDSDTVLDFSNAVFDLPGHYTYWHDLSGSCAQPASPPSPFALPLGAYSGTFNDETLTYEWYANYGPVTLEVPPHTIELTDPNDTGTIQFDLTAVQENEIPATIPNDWVILPPDQDDLRLVWTPGDELQLELTVKGAPLDRNGVPRSEPVTDIQLFWTTSDGSFFNRTPIPVNEIGVHWNTETLAVTVTDIPDPGLSDNYLMVVVDDDDKVLDQSEHDRLFYEVVDEYQPQNQLQPTITEDTYIAASGGLVFPSFTARVLAYAPFSGFGAGFAATKDGAYYYDPRSPISAPQIQSLAVGETLFDVYGLSDGAGFYAYDGRTSNGDFATLIVPDIIGVNDDPIAGDDSFPLSDSLLLSGNLLDNDTDIDHGAILTVDPAVSPFWSDMGGVVNFLGTTGDFVYDGTTSMEILAAEPGETLVDTFSYQVTDEHGATDTGHVSVVYTVPLEEESFDLTTEPALPPGWTTSSLATDAWITVAGPGSDTAPNHAFAANPDLTNDLQLMSPIFAITQANTQLVFKNAFDLPAGLDGGVLEISNGGGAFVDIVAAGGKFVCGGYSGSLDPLTSNPLAGRAAWTGSSSGYTDTVVLLPPSTAGEEIQLRWRLGSDSTGGGGGWRIDALAITDANLEPTIDAVSIPSTGAEGSWLSFSTTATDQNASDYLSYSWDFGDQTAPAAGATVQHVFAEDGAYTVALTVTDARGGAATVSQMVAVENVAPTIDSWTIPDRGLTGVPVSVSATASDAGSLDLLSYQWDFGDQSPLVPGTDATHRYTAAGVYLVTLTVDDGDGATTQVMQEIRLTREDADFNADSTVNGQDLALWQAGFGVTASATPTDGDANGDGVVNGADFLIWQTQLMGASAEQSPLTAAANLNSGGNRDAAGFRSLHPSHVAASISQAETAGMTDYPSAPIFFPAVTAATTDDAFPRSVTRRLAATPRAAIVDTVFSRPGPDYDRETVEQRVFETLPDFDSALSVRTADRAARRSVAEPCWTELTARLFQEWDGIR